MRHKVVSFYYGYFSQDWQRTRPVVHGEPMNSLSGSVRRVTHFGHEPIRRGLPEQAYY